MNPRKLLSFLTQALPLALATFAAGSSIARADVVTEWNVRANEFIVSSGLITQPSCRVMAISHTAAFEAANAITKRYPFGRSNVEAPANASVEAAIAAAHRGALTRLLPAQQAAIEAAYRTSLASIADGAAKEAGIAAGERAALDVLARRADDGAGAPEAYRPFTTAGRYVPTAIPATPQWPQRKPWLMSSPAQFRPGPPPALDSERWARDYNEVKAFGSRNSTVRSAEQTDIARFWETTLPPIYHGVVRSVAEMPGRDVMRNARLFMAVTQGIDDALIAIFEAKYHYGFWRPITAIRNADLDGNEATERDAAWTPFISTPMHPEYPCAHCIQAGTIGAVLKAELGSGAKPMLATTSSTAPGVVRRWTNVDDFAQEVGNARIYDGVHYRFSSETGLDMGRRIGELSARRYPGEVPN
jgi:hypothetical protein